MIPTGVKSGDCCHNWVCPTVTYIVLLLPACDSSKNHL
jgi:hypothetical protein